MHLLRRHTPLTIPRRVRLPTIFAGAALVFDAFTGSFLHAGRSPLDF